MINPVNHAQTAEATALYKTEPYVVAADVYARPATHRPRRVVVVHGLCRMAIPPDPGNATGTDFGEGQVALGTVSSPRVGRRMPWTTAMGNTIYHITVVQLDASDGDPVVIVDGVAQARGGDFARRRRCGSRGRVRLNGVPAMAGNALSRLH